MNKKTLSILLSCILLLLCFDSQVMAENSNNTTQLTENEIVNLIEENETFAEEYYEKINEGWVLEKVNVTYINDKGRDAVYSDGKVVESTYRQPANRKTVYLNTFSQLLADANSYIQVGLGLTTKWYIWGPITFFNISTLSIADVISNGRNEIIEDQTLYTKLVFYKDKTSNKYYANYRAYAIKKVVTCVLSYVDSNKRPYHDSKTSYYNYYSRNYQSDSILVWLANNSSGEESYNEPSSEYLN